MENAGNKRHQIISEMTQQPQAEKRFTVPKLISTAQHAVPWTCFVALCEIRQWYEVCHKNRLEKIQLVSKNTQLPFLVCMSSGAQGEPQETKVQSISLLLFGVGQSWAVSLSTSQFACGEAKRTGDHCHPCTETQTEDDFSTAADV